MFNDWVYLRGAADQSSADPSDPRNPYLHK